MRFTPLTTLAGRAAAACCGVVKSAASRAWGATPAPAARPAAAPLPLIARPAPPPVRCPASRAPVKIPRAMTNRLLLSLVLLAASSDGAVPVPDSAAARIFRDAAAGTLVIDLAPMDLPAHTPHHLIAQPPVATLAIPETGFIYGFRVLVVHSAGHALPAELIHHFNLIDPDHRELFLPISRRLLAAGHETGAIRLPRLLFGLPLERGEHVVASAMVENLTATTYVGARVRLAMNFT